MDRTHPADAGDRAVEAAPLVSAIVPAYDAGATIEQTLDSLLVQTHPNLEIIVVDDGSSDDSAKLVEGIIGRDERVSLIRQANSGVAAARNTGIERARGKLIAPVDADDLWLPDAMERLVARLEDCGADYGVAYGWSFYLDAEGRPTGSFRAATIEGDVFATLICHNFLGNASCSLIRRECIEAVGGYDTGFRERSEQGCEDWDLYVRLARLYRFCVVPALSVGYRKIPGRMSSKPERMATSHRHMLEKLEVSDPTLPRFMSQLSTSSFYFYLANECGSPEDRTWLRRAFAAGPLFCLIRPAFYETWVTSLLFGDEAEGHRAPEPEATSSAPTIEVAPFVWSTARTLRLHLMLLRQQVMHAIVSAAWKRTSGVDRA